MSPNPKTDPEKEEIIQAEGDLLNARKIPEGEEPVTDVEWVPVVRDLDPVQMEVLKGDLNLAGIPVVITGGRMDTLLIYPNAENAILVPTQWAEEAKEIVNDFLKQSEENPDIDVCSSCGAEVPPDADVCPSCGEGFTGEVSEEEADKEE